MKKYLIIISLFLSSCSCNKNEDKDYMKAARMFKNYLDSTWHEAKKEVPDYKPKD